MTSFVVTLLERMTVVLGGLILTASWIPQIYKTLHTRSAKDLSVPFLLAASTGTLLLVPYSFYINDAFFIFVNLFAGLLAAVALVVALIYRKD
jgi:uncharacterized protein with PQ loop repeat